MFNFLKRSIFFGAMLGTTLATAACANAGDYANPELLMGADELAMMTGNGVAEKKVIVIDVRPREEFAAGHIPGARHLDPNEVVDSGSPIEGALKSQPEVVNILSSLGINADTRVVYYDDKAGFHAARMFWLTEYYGHRKVSVLNGGLTAWTAAGHSLSKEVAEHQTARFVSALSPRRYAAADYILERQDDVHSVVIDVRPIKLYEKGHIPWAKNVPWKGNLTDDGFYKSAASLASHFAAQGVTGNRNVVIHCQTGLASSHSYVALRLLGYPKVRVYHRSWAEWGTAGDLPIEKGA
ncbi:sulfurtransferase [Pelagibius sp. Alg239-R121]|uniref:sulfurtransferase n=1 Tax=Pelagibius sp. Alg239-R121 TaxID=2993448 RepID=UPI0024A76F93|nr:sulfurtransferase [Pelagibius sp. Alg239-R121]